MSIDFADLDHRPKWTEPPGCSWVVSLDLDSSVLNSPRKPLGIPAGECPELPSFYSIQVWGILWVPDHVCSCDGPTIHRGCIGSTIRYGRPGSNSVNDQGRSESTVRRTLRFPSFAIRQVIGTNSEISDHLQPATHPSKPTRI